MRVNKLEVNGFRNIKKAELIPCGGINIIYGENAQGKTNFIEALWLFTGEKSFRNSKDTEMINFKTKKADLSLKFFAEGREKEAEISIEDKKRVILNKIPLQSASKMNGKFCAVVFAPSHLSLIKGGPHERRHFIDMAICQLKPQYNALLREYGHTVIQRNTLLKDIQYHSELLDTLEIWEEKIANYGSKIIAERNDYIDRLQVVAEDIYSGFSQGKESLKIKYIQSSNITATAQSDICEQLKEAIKSSRKNDMQYAVTSVGPHRDDIDIEINGCSARTFGSQGQQRSVVLSLKLGEATILKNFMGEIPVMLFDDVMSELDLNRQDYILNHIKGWQVFITCCEPSPILKMSDGRTFHIENGEIV